ncbi:MAG: MDR family MFS transporter [Actinocrinis sp.]
MVRLRAAARSTYGGLPSAFWWIWLGTLVNRMGGFVLPFFAFYITGPLHRSAALAGAVTAVFGVGAAISGVVGGVLTDRIGRKPTLVGSLLANAVTIIALGYAKSPWLLALGALAVGLATNAFRPAQSAMIADLVPAADRVRAYALNFWAINLGFSVSMAAVGLISHFGYLTLFYADAASTAACAVLIAVMVHDTTPGMVGKPGLVGRGARIARASAAKGAHATHGQSDIQSDIKRDGLGTVLRDRTYITFVATTFLVLLVFNQCQSGLPIQMATAGLSPSLFGEIAAINGVLIVLLQMPVTRLLRGHPAGRVLAGASLVIGAGFGVLAFGESVAMYVLCVIVMTLGEIAYTPTAQAVSARLSPEHLRGRYQGVYQLSWTLSSVVSPLAGGAVIGAWGGRPLWIACFVGAAATALVFLRIGRHVERRVAEAVLVERRTTQVAASIGDADAELATA